jgi:hypothetical protein
VRHTPTSWDLGSARQLHIEWMRTRETLTSKSAPFESDKGCGTPSLGLRVQDQHFVTCVLRVSPRDGYAEGLARVTGVPRPTASLREALALLMAIST